MYIVYVKGPGLRRFRPLGRTGPVVNLFHAVTFTDYEAAQADLDALSAANPGYLFEVRKRS